MMGTLFVDTAAARAGAPAGLRLLLVAAAVAGSAWVAWHVMSPPRARPAGGAGTLHLPGVA